METEQHNVETHPEVTAGPGHTPTFVENIKEKLAAVKEKIIGHHEHPSAPASSAEGEAHDLEVGEEQHEHVESSPRGGMVSTARGSVVSHPVYDDTPIPEGGLIMTAAPEEPESPEEHQGFREKMKIVFSFPVPDTTLTPEKDFEETVPPNLKI